MKMEANRITEPTENDWASRSRIQTFILLLATGFGMYLCYLLAAPFLPARTSVMKRSRWRICRGSIR